MKRPVILMPLDYYLPGFKAGGALRTCANIVERLGCRFSFRIITRDRDLGDNQAYGSVKTDAWNHAYGGEVYYVPPGGLGMASLAALMNAVEYDVVYLNSFFSPYFTIAVLLMRKLGMIPKKPVILAPRGEFSGKIAFFSAGWRIAAKSVKKTAYIWLGRALGLFRDVVFHASNVYEEQAICKCLGRKTSVMIARDILPSKVAEVAEGRPPKRQGALKIVFLSRISREKNLAYLLTLLSALHGRIECNIYGPKGDEMYWKECEEIIRRMPANVAVGYCGAVEHENVANVMAAHDLFMLPSRGENFGHVILEALLAGCPALISDRTAFRNLSPREAGWDLPLERPEHFREILELCTGMDETTHARWRQGARRYALETIKDEDAVRQMEGVFLKALNSDVQ